MVSNLFANLPIFSVEFASLVCYMSYFKTPVARYRSLCVPQWERVHMYKNGVWPDTAISKNDVSLISIRSPKSGVEPVQTFSTSV